MYRTRYPRLLRYHSQTHHPHQYYQHQQQATASLVNGWLPGGSTGQARLTFPHWLRLENCHYSRQLPTLSILSNRHYRLDYHYTGWSNKNLAIANRSRVIQVNGHLRSLETEPLSTSYTTYNQSSYWTLTIIVGQRLRGHSRSLKLVPFKSLGAVSYSPSIVTMAVSVAVCETFSVKEWRDLENQVRGRSRSLKMAPFDRPCATFYWSAIVNINTKKPQKFYHC